MRAVAGGLRVGPCGTAAPACIRRRSRILSIDGVPGTDGGQGDIAYAIAGIGAGDATGPQLYLVGDPKQSIYRFRRADISVWNAVANDIAVQGAVPLFFMDYFAVGKLDSRIAAEVISGIARGCQANGCALIGGGTAEMPGCYAPSEYDLAGFIVGAGEGERLLRGAHGGPAAGRAGVEATRPERPRSQEGGRDANVRGERASGSA